MKILLIDDHELFCEGLELVLLSLDPATIVSHETSMEAAVQRLQTHEAPDLIVTDLLLPGCKGLDALRRVREAASDIPVVVLAGADDPVLIREAIEAGAMGYLPKASSSGELARALQLILNGGVYLPMAVKAAIPKPKGLHLKITARQREVLGGLLQGKSNKVIARELGISEPTVKSHVAAVLAALDVHSRAQAVYAVAGMDLPLSKILVEDGGSADGSGLPPN